MPRQFNLTVFIKKATSLNNRIASHVKFPVIGRCFRLVISSYSFAKCIIYIQIVLVEIHRACSTQKNLIIIKENEEHAFQCIKLRLYLLLVSLLIQQVPQTLELVQVNCRIFSKQIAKFRVLIVFMSRVEGHQRYTLRDVTSIFGDTSSELDELVCIH